MALKINALIAAAGLVVFCVGVGAVYWPAALIVFGAALVAAGLFLNVARLAA